MTNKNYQHDKVKNTKKMNFIPVTNIPKPKPPKYWKPTKEEIERNSLLREAYEVEEK